LRDNLVFRQQMTDHAPSTMDLKVEAMVIGDVKYIICADGRTFYEGETLDDGSTLQAIQRERVTVKKGGKKMVVHLGNVPILLEY
jgi:hypothetical protein